MICDSTNLLAVSGQFAIPATDLDWLSAHVPPPEQKRARVLLQVLAEIDAAQNKLAAFASWSASLRSHPDFADQRGYSWVRLRDMYYAYKRTNDWRVCLNKAKIKGTGPKGMAPDFIKFWRKLCEDNQRVTSEAWRELKLIFRTGFDSHGKPMTIPGCPSDVDPKTGLPIGWSYGNLARLAPDNFELAAARIGRKAASQFRLKMRTTRVGLAVGEFYEFDDHEFNVKVVFPGQLRPMRPRCFAAVDVLSGSPFALVGKPTFWDLDEEKKKALTERDFMWFVIYILTHHGYRTDARGTTLCVEHGTAAIRPWFEENLTNLIPTLKIQRGGRFNHPAHKGQFAAEYGGNFRFKPHVEGFWRMIDDRLAALHGQVGKDRNHSPEELQRLDNYVSGLLRAAQTMPVERAAQLIIPRLTWSKFMDLVYAKLDALDTDPDHDLEGWEKLGFIAEEFRLPLAPIGGEGQGEGALLSHSSHPSHASQPAFSPWLPIAAMPPEVRALVASNDLLYRTRRLTRREVWRAGQRELTKLSPAQIPALVGRQHALRGGEPLTVREGVFEFQDSAISADPLQFVAQDHQGRRFREGEKFVCFVNPLSPDVLVACDDDLCVRGLCPAWNPVPRNDAHAIQRQMGAVNKWEADALAEQRARHATDAEAIEFMRRHNEALLAGKTKSPRLSAADRRDGQAAADAILDPSDPISPLGPISPIPDPDTILDALSEP